MTVSFEEAVQLYNKADYAGAEDAFAQLTEKAPDQSVYWLNLGNAQFKMDKLVLAESNWQKTLELNPLEANAYLNIGNYYYADEDYQLAITYWEKYLKLESSNSTVLLNLGLAYERLGRLWYAFEFYKQYLEVAAGRENANVLQERIEKGKDVYLNNVSLADKLLKTGQIDKAIEAYDKTLGLYPATPKVYKAYGAALMTRQHFNGAVQAYEAAFEQYDADGTVLINLGVAYEKINDPFNAIWAYQKAVALQVKEARQLIDRINGLISAKSNIFQLTYDQAKVSLTLEHLNVAERQFKRLADVLDFCPELRDKVPGALSVIAREKDPMEKAKHFFYDAGEKAREAGNYPGAMSAYNKYLEIAPDGKHAAEVTQKKESMQQQMGQVIKTMLNNSAE